MFSQGSGSGDEKKNDERKKMMDDLDKEILEVQEPDDPKPSSSQEPKKNKDRLKEKSEMKKSKELKKDKKKYKKQKTKKESSSSDSLTDEMKEETKKKGLFKIEPTPENLAVYSCHPTATRGRRRDVKELCLVAPVLFPQLRRGR